MKNKIRIISTISLCLLMVVAVFAVVPMNIGAEGEPPEEPGMEGEGEWWVEGNGTYFELTNSAYLNVTFTSSENVHIYLKSVPQAVSYCIEPDCAATTTEITLTGFEASKTYYRYQGGYLQENFTTDEYGSYIYTQDISTPHHVFIQEIESTIYIKYDGSISPSDAPINKQGSTYKLTANIYEPIVIFKSDITLDGNGFSLQGSGSYAGVILEQRSGVTITDLTINGFGTGIELFESSYNTISGNTISGCSYDGICMYGYYSWFNTISGNIVSANSWSGIFLTWGAWFNTISGNVFSANSNYGIWLCDSLNTVTGNTISNSDYGICGGWSNTITGNTVSNSDYGIRVSSSNTVSGNTVSNSDYGIRVSGNSNTINGNTVSGNTQGIRLLYSDSNAVSGNTVSGNSYGIYLKSSDGNTIFHNNIIDNTKQVYNYESTNTWDNGDCEGNYWSDYEGEDTNQDGIGDTEIPHPYTDQGEGYYQLDNYPIMNPWSPDPVTAIGQLKSYIEGQEIPSGTKNSLIKQLEAAENALANDQDNTAVNILNAFMHHVEALRGNKLTEEQADYMTSSAEAIIDIIEGA